MIGGGFAYKTCDCEDFPCCGHNDVDPNWEPDPYDQYEEDWWDDEEWDVICQKCGKEFEPHRSDTHCDPCYSIVSQIMSQQISASKYRLARACLFFDNYKKAIAHQKAATLSAYEARDEGERR